MKNLHIISVGASLLSNYIKKKDKERLQKMDNNEEPLPNLDNDKEYSKILSNKKIVSDIYNYVKEKPYEASAELNSLKDFIDNKKIDEIRFIITDTNISKLASVILARYLEENLKIKVDFGPKISGYYKEYDMNIKSAESIFIVSLSKLKNNLIKYIAKKNKSNTYKIYINATGGFKPEIVILMFVGSLTKTTVYYKHEFFKKTVFIPPLFLPYLNSEHSKALTNLKQNNIIKGENITKFKEKYKNTYSDFINFNLIEENYNRNGKLRLIKLTNHGKFLADLI